MEYDYRFEFKCNLNSNDKRTYEQFGNLYELLITNYNKTVVIDMGKVDFFSANLFAVLGACLDSTIEKNGHTVYFKNINSKISALMARNKFGRAFSMKKQEDRFESCIDYAMFKAETEQLEEFEKYILLQIFNHKEIPLMSENYKNRIIDNFLEIFNNVIDHAEAKYVYVCGQFFPKSQSFVFSIVDVGLTFEQKISNYFKICGKNPPMYSIEWALQSGNTTKLDSPGGLGLTTLMDFLTRNKGSFSIISNNEFYEYNSKGERTILLGNFFPGTIVTIDVNLKDSNHYIIEEDNDEIIVF